MFSVTVPDLTAALVALVRQVPRGRVTTFGDVAAALGDRTAARWVAVALLEPPESLRDAAHRVVRATGEPGRVPPDALDRLVKESVPIEAGRVLVSAARFDGFVGDAPLQRLREEQERLAAAARLTPFGPLPETVAAVDVSYRADGIGVGAYVLMKTGEDEPLWTTTAAVTAGFPYIPGFLSYRELPVHAELLRRAAEAGRTAPLLLVDGAGLLHPRRSGVATQLGVLADLPTIGVSKRMLCGRVVPDERFGPGTATVIDRDEAVAAVLPPVRNAKGPQGTRPIFVSPGHRCTVPDAVAAVLAWRRGRKLPEPIRLADALSRAVAQAGVEPAPNAEL